MNNYFLWNGEDCRNHGFYVLDQPVSSIPKTRATFTNVPGRHGSVTTLEGKEVYDDVVMSCTCMLYDPEVLPDVAEWLRGAGLVTFANRPTRGSNPAYDVHYEARVQNQIDLERIMRGNPQQKFTIQFLCHPFAIAENVSDITVTTSGTTVTSPANVECAPVIRVNGSGKITLMIGGQLIDLSDVNEYVVIDSQLLECYKGANLTNNQMNGDFPMLYPGANMVSWVADPDAEDEDDRGSVTSVVIQPNWRWVG